MISIVDDMIFAALQASKVILEVYAGAPAHTSKADGSPVTEADARAEAVIFEQLRDAGLPIIAEESAAAGRIPEFGEQFFVVDPLDGTKEFLKRNGEFTVNIALCERGAPRVGVIAAPARGLVYWGAEGSAWMAGIDGRRTHDSRKIAVAATESIRIVASRSHGHASTKTLIERLKVAEDVSVGSALKFCLMAEGKAELYPRFGPTSEWDTAAGQAILEAAGGVVYDLDGQPLTCGHADRTFLNPAFVAAASHDLAVATLAEMRRLA